jgi:hypothetical protein
VVPNDPERHGTGVVVAKVDRGASDLGVRLDVLEPVVV